MVSQKEAKRILERMQRRNRETTKAWRERQKEEGRRHVACYIDAEAWEALERARALGPNTGEIVSAALRTYGGEGNTELIAQAESVSRLRLDNEWMEREINRQADEIADLKRRLLRLDPEAEADAPSEPAAPADPHQAPEDRETLSKAELLERVDAMTQDGLTYNQIAERFNADGIATPSGRGTWKKTTVANLVRRK
jgi:transposase